ncbi:MAG TPA: DUF4270 family protein [Bacteroidia bacterium]|nr:DUF4270 family protein [Bacteroidia bacterium]
MRKITSDSKILRVLVPAKFFLGLATCLALGLFSCKKDSNLGITTQPGNDLLNVKSSDSTTVVAWTRKEDSLPTTGALTQYVLGNYWDPVFGKANASIYTQFVIHGADINLNFCPSGDPRLVTCDSLVMTLSYGKTYYGDTTTPQTIRVYQLTGSLIFGHTYNSDTAIAVYSVPVGVKTFYPTPHTPSVLLKHPVGTHVRIPLDKNLGQLIINQSNQFPLQNDANFVTMFKGFYIRADAPLNRPGQGAMLYLPLTDTLTKLTVYLKNGNYPSHTGDSLNYSFEVNAASVSFPHFEHDFSGGDPKLVAELAAAKNATQPVYPTWLPAVHPASEPVVFASSMAGTKVKVDFPYLTNWVKNGMISVNKAELTVRMIPNPPAANPTYAPVDQLALVSIDSLGHETTMIDYLEGTDYFGGVFDPINAQYVFHIDRYIQQVMLGKIRNNGLYLVATSSSTAANRVILGGPTNPSGFKMTLRLNYTRLH